MRRAYLYHSLLQEINLAQKKRQVLTILRQNKVSSSAAHHQRQVVNERWPYYPNQEDINDLVREMSLTESNAELLISRLKQWDLLDDSVQITFQH